MAGTTSPQAGRLLGVYLLPTTDLKVLTSGHR
jgi:hypothetical protein